VQSQNPAAWYVCEGKQLFLNLGDYLYQTPSGCSDETVRFLSFVLNSQKLKDLDPLLQRRSSGPIEEGQAYK
jgi:hypothetical protein